MNSRIKQFMDYKGISSSELADTIGVQRSNVTHVLQGRNKPGFQFISKMLETYPDLNAKWLITGEGMMLGSAEPLKKPDLFDIPKPKRETEALIQPEKDVQEVPKTPEVMNIPVPEPTREPVLLPSDDKAIERIVIFYTDQTFKQYLPSK